MFSLSRLSHKRGLPGKRSLSSHRGLGPAAAEGCLGDTSIKAPAVGSATGVITGFNKVEVLVRSSDGSQFEPAKKVCHLQSCANLAMQSR